MTDMETIEAYLNRKHAELRLFNDCLRGPLTLPYPRSVTEVINHKFQLTAALRSEHELYEWSATETAWSMRGDVQADPSSLNTTISAPISMCAALLFTQ